MVEHEESLMEKIAEKIHGHNSSSDSDDDKPSKTSVFRPFGRERPVHRVFVGGKHMLQKLFFSFLKFLFFFFLKFFLWSLKSILFVCANVEIVLNRSPTRIPEVQIPKDPVLECAQSLRFEINCAFSVLQDIASGRYLKKFLSVIASLWVLSIVGSWCNFLTLFYIVFILLHTVLVLYEKYEDKVDPFAEKAMHEIKKQCAVLNTKFLRFRGDG
ncbi:reticulon-like protein B3 [Gossypium australe]|uniref:Reticulon-like protein n=1 Tax=Gossypium australe TaxID=47621 RepID=A0A5B6W3P7_9ROSI|nr:reticulon-like protein B3 [Gossypium australe]